MVTFSVFSNVGYSFIIMTNTIYNAVTSNPNITVSQFLNNCPRTCSDLSATADEFGLNTTSLGILPLADIYNSASKFHDFEGALAVAEGANQHFTWPGGLATGYSWCPSSTGSQRGSHDGSNK
jgi:hypothetical protein